jgi:hypothetical protein
MLMRRLLSGYAGKFNHRHKRVQRPRSMARALTCYWAVRRLGLPSIEMARRFGISTAAVSKAIERGESLAADKKINLDS